MIRLKCHFWNSSNNWNLAYHKSKMYNPSGEFFTSRVNKMCKFQDMSTGEYTLSYFPCLLWIVRRPFKCKVDSCLHIHDSQYGKSIKSLNIFITFRPKTLLLISKKVIRGFNRFTSGLIIKIIIKFKMLLSKI